MTSRIALVLAAVVALAAGPATADMSDGVIKMGVLNDQSSLYADLAGQGSVVAARMAVEATEPPPRASRSRSSSPATRTRPTSARRSRVSGTTSTRWT